MTVRAVRAVSTAVLPSVLVAVGALAPPASAANRQRLQVSIRPLASAAATGSRPIALHFTLARSTDDGALSSPASDDRFYLPRGYELNPGGIPTCTVNALAQRGPGVCRRAR